MHPFKFCPICGNEKLTNVKQDLIICKNCHYQWYQNPKPVVNIIITDHDNRVLILKRNIQPKKGTWDIPGGFLDLNESFVEAATREIHEELNIEVDGSALVYWNEGKDLYDFPPQLYRVVGCFYLLKINSSEISKIKLDKENSDLAWINSENLDNYKIGFKSTYEMLKKYFNENPSIKQTKDNDKNSKARLEDLRNEIDLIDLQLIKNLAKRQNLVKIIGEIKLREKLPIYDNQRWSEIVKTLEKMTAIYGLDFEIVTKIWELIHLNSLRVERAQSHLK